MMGRYESEENSAAGKFIGISVIVLLLAGGGWFYFNQAGEEQPMLESKPLAVPRVSESRSEPELADETLTDQDGVETTAESTEEPFVLPELAASDHTFRTAVQKTSAQLLPWLQSDQLIRKYLAVVNDFSQGLWLEKHMRFLKQASPFSVNKTDEGLFIAEKSYRRYDNLASAIDAIDVKEAVAVFHQFEPLFLDVFEDFGYPPERPLEDLFLKSAAQILAAPVIEQPVALVRPSVYYKYADEQLEALSPVAKQMLRMGPKNTRIIQNKVRALVEELVNSKE